MYTPASSACACIRTRSPRMAPPVNGLEGSTAMTPTVRPSCRYAAMSRSTMVLLPAPGGPVMPITRPCAACGVTSVASSAPTAVASAAADSARAIARGSRARTPAKIARAVSVAKELPCDDEPLNLARPLANRAELDVAVELLGRIVLHESVAAVNLHALFGGAHG